MKSPIGLLTPVLIFLWLIGISGFGVNPTMAQVNHPELPFVDVPADHEAREALVYLYENEWIVGYPDGTFKGERFFSRYELAMVLGRTWCRLNDEFAEHGLDIGISGFVPPYRFQDVPVDHWSRVGGLDLLADQNLLSWTDADKNFNGNSYANRVDLAIFFGRMLDRIEDAYRNAGIDIDHPSADNGIVYSDLAESEYAYEEILKIVNLGIMPGYSDNQWHGECVFNRYEFAQIWADFLQSTSGRLEAMEPDNPLPGSESSPGGHSEGGNAGSHPESREDAGLSPSAPMVLRH